MKTFKELKIRSILFNNLALKLLAIVIAIFVWIIVINIDDPSQRKTISGIQVELLNESDLTNKGYTYDVVQGGTISVVVRGPQSVIEELKSSDFYAYADLSERTPQSNKSKITVSCTKEDVLSQIDIVSQQTDYVELSIDNKISKNFDVEIEITGEPATGYVVNDYSVSPTTVNVAGAQTTVESISYAKITYNVSGLSADNSDTVAPVFYDEDGNVINTDKLELNWDTVKVSVSILPTKEVAVNYAATGTPLNGYLLENVVGSLDKVVISGTKENLDKIDSIDIPAGVIDVTGISSDKEYTIALSSYLSEEYKIVSSDKELTVTAQVEKIQQKTITIPFSDIDVMNMESNYEISYVNDTGDTSLDVVITGAESDIADIEAEDLNATIDLTGKTVGSSRVKVIVEDSDSYEVEGSYYVWILITDSNESPTTTTEETTTDQTETTTDSQN